MRRDNFGLGASGICGVDIAPSIRDDRRLPMESDPDWG